MGKLKATVKAAEKALDMSQAARMKRAQEMGADIESPVYHVSNAVFAGSPRADEARAAGIAVQDEFKPNRYGTYFSDSPDLTESIFSDNPYADKAGEYVIRRGREFDARYVNMNDEQKAELQRLISSVVDEDDIYDAASRADVGVDEVDPFDIFTDGDFYTYYGRDAQDRLLRAINEAGYDTVRFTDNLAMGDNTTSTVVFDPSRVRSVNAAFDPAKKDSANLLAGIGGAAVIGGAAQSNEANAMTDDMVMDSLRAAASVAEFSERRKQKSSYWAGRRQDLLNLFTGMTNNALDAVDMPWRGILGLTGAAGSLAAGNSLSDALNTGANLARQPVDQTAYQLGGAVTDATGSPALGTAVNLGVNLGGPI